jgi:hypothetical protein
MLHFTAHGQRATEGSCKTEQVGIGPIPFWEFMSTRPAAVGSRRQSVLQQPGYGPVR